jgi:hypothetical protein
MRCLDSNFHANSKQNPAKSNEGSDLPGVFIREAASVRSQPPIIAFFAG